MLKFINLKKLTAKSLIGILMIGGLITPAGTKKAVASNGVQGLELRYEESAFQCGSDTRQADIRVEVRDKSNNDLLTTLSKGDTFTSNDYDSINDLNFIYKIYNFSHCGMSNGTTRSVGGSMLLGADDAVPTLAGFSGQSSVGQIHSGLDSYEELLLVELGTSNTSSSSYDLQDVVLVVDNNPVVPTLWGIDEDDGQLFSMGDYTDKTTMTDYGKLKWNDNGTIRTINTDMEAMTLDENGDMYIALDRKLSGTGRGATLLKFNIADASTFSDNVVRVVGEIGINFDNNNDNVSGLSIDPNTGQLIALLKNNGGSATDKLYIISKSSGNVIKDIGAITGLGASSSNAEDIEHAPDGTLYVTDNADDHTYKVNGSTGAIIEVVDNNQKGGLGSDSAKFEALGWDFANDRLIGFDDNDESLAKLTLKNGDNQEYYDTTSIGLTDVEGVDFVPTIDGLPTDFLDYDGDGFEDPVEEDPLDPDADSDGDGISNGVEGTADDDNDDIPNYLDPDSDNNNIDDEIEVGSDPANPIDSDGDEIPDYLDDDDDDNGIPDFDPENGIDEIGNDPTNNPTGYDLNGDDIPDIYPNDLDGDEIPDYLDDDDDGDGIPDFDPDDYSNSEIGDDPTNPVDTDGDEIPDYQDTDSDDDGIDDVNEGAGDADEDGFPNFQDLDSDNNTILDSDEISGSSFDTDGVDNYLDLDDDDDGIIDVIEIGNQRFDDSYDSDGDKTPNYQDTDSDNDGILDANEGIKPSAPDETTTTIKVIDHTKSPVGTTIYKLQDMSPDDTKKNGRVCVDADAETGNKCIIRVRPDDDGKGKVTINNSIRNLDSQIQHFAD